MGRRQTAVNETQPATHRPAPCQRPSLAPSRRLQPPRACPSKANTPAYEFKCNLGSTSLFPLRSTGRRPTRQAPPSPFLWKGPRRRPEEGARPVFFRPQRRAVTFLGHRGRGTRGSLTHGGRHELEEAHRQAPHAPLGGRSWPAIGASVRRKPSNPVLPSSETPTNGLLFSRSHHRGAPRRRSIFAHAGQHKAKGKRGLESAQNSPRTEGADGPGVQVSKQRPGSSCPAHAATEAPRSLRRSLLAPVSWGSGWPRRPPSEQHWTPRAFRQPLWPSGCRAVSCVHGDGHVPPGTHCPATDAPPLGSPARRGRLWAEAFPALRPLCPLGV
ncbi:uncharacterized protein LOC130455877 [Monodelphis domestica]|uniref:uncharacterized protein LOC130455877 n=1 Tax=Monodelphis domestica TaxID=13616 RepID=UPI0024E26E2A|nr:uncharacterized protein LOC130455877 [Monodelphis domestica]